MVATGAHTQPKARIENLLSLRKNFRLRRRCRSYFLVYCSFPISKFPRRRRPFLNFYLPPCWWSQKARVHCSFPISKFPRRRRPFLNFHTALLMIATGAHTQTKSTSGKQFASASRKFSLSATVLKLFSSTLFFSDFKFFRPSEALARENFPISNVSRPRVVLYFLLSLSRATRVFSLLYIFIWAWRICPP